MLLQRDLCVVDADHVWMLQIDKRAVTIDVNSGSVSAADRRSQCTKGMVEVPSGFGGPPGLIYQFEPGAFKAPDFASLSMMPFTATSSYVMVGKKSPGTPSPMVAGFDLTRHALLWQEPLPAVDPATVRSGTTGLGSSDVCGDHFYGAYGVGTKDWHATALDAKSGVRQWDVVLRSTSTVNGVGCSASHVFVSRGDGLDVLDAVTGKLVGTIS